MTISAFNSLLSEKNVKIGTFTKKSGFQVIFLNNEKVKFFPSLVAVADFLRQEKTE